MVGAQTLDVDAVMEERDLGLLERLVDRGEWDLCVQVGEVAAARGMRSPRWAEVRVEALQRLGRLEEALKVLTEQRAALPDHLPMALRQHAILSALGRKEEAMAVLREVNAVAQKQPPAKRTAADWVALGQAALAAGADAKQVIARYYQVARRLDPKSVAAYLAEGRLALEKWDPAQAAKVFQEGFTACGEGAGPG